MSASFAACSDFTHESKVIVVCLSPIMSAIAFARTPQFFRKSIVGRPSSFAEAAKGMQSRTAIVRAIFELDMLYFSHKPGGIVAGTGGAAQLRRDGIIGAVMSVVDE
jgi:hypothetical protein